MHTVKTIKAEGSVFLITLSDGRRIYATQGAAVSMGLDEGVTLDEDMLAVLLVDDEKHRCLKKALSLLGYSDKSRRDLYIRLSRLGYSRDAVEYALDCCEDMGYLDENRQIERACLGEANVNLRGPRMIMGKLISKGYDRAKVERALLRLVDEGEIDFSENLERLCEKKGVTDGEERKALAYKSGYIIY